jgi:F-type H+-transporting ATPase subunit b
LERLGINGGFFLAQLLNFLVLFGALTLLAWRPLVRALEARREKIAKGLEDARVAETARANAEREAEKTLEQGRAQANKVVEEARMRGEEQAKSVLDDARKEAETIRTRARSEAEEERNSLLGEVRTQVAQLAMAAAERVLGQSIDQGKAQGIINDFFSAVPAEARNVSGANVDVTTALPLSKPEQDNVTKQLGAQNVNFRVDPSILGGIVVRAGDRVIDGSVRSNLQNLAAQIR